MVDFQRIRTFHFVMANRLARFRFFRTIHCFLVFFMSFGLLFSVKAQKSNQNSNFELSGDLLLTIEEYLESAGGENDVDVLELYEYLQQVYQNKLELNKLTKEDLFRLNLLSDAQVNNFFLYRNNFGPFISLHEIQAIPSFDINSIQRILPFIRFDSDRNQNESSIPDKLKNGNHEIILRSQRNLESLAG